jgi:tRNA pseudouridine32 synthase/23S rRNA pseudouridine746 synthase
MTRPRPSLTEWQPPTRDGVGPSGVATVPGDWPDAAHFLAARLPALTLAQWRARLAAGEVLDAAGQPLGADAPHVPHTRLWYWRALPPDVVEPVIPFEAELLHQDAHLIAVDKPHFLPMAPKGRHVQQTLLVRLKRQLGIDTLVPMHRLDRETAGVVLFMVRPQDRAAYQARLRERQVDKVYEAVAPWRAELGVPLTRRSRLVESPASFMQRIEVEGEPNGVTHLELIARLAAAPGPQGAQGPAGPWGHYRLKPETGQTHQLRVHLAALGAPIVGDRIYPVLQPEPPLGTAPDFEHPLQLLARAIAFTDPVTGARRRFESRRTLAEVAVAGGGTSPG